MEIWINWEQETKELLQKMYLELLDKGEIASADFVCELIRDVTTELSEARTYYLTKKILGYDLGNIMGEQYKTSKAHYKKLIKRIKKVGEDNGDFSNSSGYLSFRKYWYHDSFLIWRFMYDYTSSAD